MKRILTAIASVLVVAALCVCFAGCATDVKGKTYVYEEAVLKIDKELTDTEQAAANLVKAVVNDLFDETEVAFDAESDKATVGGLPYKYTQEGATVKITSLTGASEYEYTASGSTLEREFKKDGYTFTLVYKIKK